MPHADPSLSIAERVDAACDRFEAEWKAGNRPRIEDYLAAAPESDRQELRQALLAIELELQGRGQADTSVSQSSVRSDDKVVPVMTVDHVPGSSEMSTTVGRFEIRGVLGSGAFGKVYRAFDPQLGREVALKVPLEAAVKTATERAQFLKEARAAATINHPNVCQIHEVGEHDGRPYIVMALVPGQSLGDALKARTAPLPEKQVALIIRKIALALAAAHGKGIVHRDLKPANVMFDRERKDIVVMDFGLARGPRVVDTRATQSGVVMGTPAYMSPEQARGESKAVGPAGDVFSLGVILYELLSGARPFNGTAMDVIGQILHVDPEPPSKRRPNIDPRLEAVCLKAMAKDPAARFGTMREFAAAMDAVLRTPKPTGPAAETAKAAETRQNTEMPGGDTLGEVLAALSADRKQARAETAAAVEAAIAGHRTPRWVFLLAGLLLVGGLTALGSIIFFTRSDKVKVTIELTDVDLADKTLSFFLDEEPISAEALAKPIELKPGEHVLVVKRGKEIVKRVLLTVAGGRSPGLKLKDITPPAKQEPSAAKTPEPDPLIGTWDWGWGEVEQGKEPMYQNRITFHADGTCVSEIGGIAGKWERSGKQITIRLANNATDVVTMSEDGRKLNGKGIDGTPVRGKKSDSDRELAAWFLQNGLNVVITTRDVPTTVEQFEATRQYVSRPEALPEVPFRLVGLVWPHGHHKQLRPEVIRRFGEAKNLVQFDLFGCQQFDDSALAAVSACRGLVQVQASATRVTDAGLKHLRGMKHLQRLELGFTRVTGTGLADMPDAPLVWLRLSSAPGTPEGVEAICRFKELQELDVDSDRNGDREARQLFQSLPRLRTVHIGYARLTDEGLAGLVDLKELRWLSLTQTHITGEGLRHLAGLPVFRAVELHHTPLRDDGLRHLRQIPKLDLLLADNTRITDAGLAHLKGMESLAEISIRGTVVTDAGLKHLAGLRNLHLLALDSTRITDEGLKHLGDCPSLTGLWLNNTAVTDAGLEQLKKLPQLSKLVLAKTGVTDAALKHLTVIRSLKELDLTDTSVTADGLRRLKQALPACKITP